MNKLFILSILTKHALIISNQGAKMLKNKIFLVSYLRGCKAVKISPIMKTIISVIFVMAITSINACKHNNEHKSVTQPTLPMKFPSDVAQTCVPSSIDSWFASGNVTKNGTVNAANSTGTFTTDCDFYKWGSQMFLWLTSPVSGGSNGTYTFNQPGFYDVTPANSNGNRQFIAGVAGQGGLKSIGLRFTKSEDSDFESGQADGNALISTKKDVIFYGLHANDIFAYYRSEEANGNFPTGNLNNNFPTNALEVDLISLLLPKDQNPITDPNALAMELKTAWVDISNVSDASQYITITTDVPVYSKNSTNTKWTETSETESKTLALIGLHIVGTVTGHPEMVWTTIEHVNNAPDKSYYYLTQKTPDVAKNSPFTGSPINGKWTLNATPATDANAVPTTAAYNAATGSKPAYIEGNLEPLYTENKKRTVIMPITPAKVVRLNPWGNTSSPLTANKNKVAQSNTDLVSLNASVMSALAATKDVRSNYIQIGGIWDKTGAIPNSGDVSTLAGGLYLANTTMETFHQYPDANNGFQTTNCFACHNANPSKQMQCLNKVKKDRQPYDTSHIFCATEPLWVGPPLEPGPVIIPKD